MSRKPKSSPPMAVLAVFLGLCLCKPPEATRLATSPSFGLTRGATSYLPRKQQRVRVVSSRSRSVRDELANASGSKAALSPHQTVAPPRFFQPPDRGRIRARAEKEIRRHPLRC